MITFITVVYVLVCIFLILVVLLQAGRGGGMGAAMGGSSQTVFGGAGAGNFLQRLTVISASLFMILSASLAYLSSSGEQALERADERVRAREAARTIDSNGSNDKVAAAVVVDAGLSALPELTAPGLLQEPATEDTADSDEAAQQATQEALAEDAPAAEPQAEAAAKPTAPAKKKAAAKPAATVPAEPATPVAQPEPAAPQEPAPVPEAASAPAEAP